jgi:hypothetical protein
MKLRSLNLKVDVASFVFDRFIGFPMIHAWDAIFQRATNSTPTSKPTV